MLNIYIFFFLTKLHFVTIECTPQMSSSQGLRTSLSTLSITFHSSILMGLCFNLFFAFTNEQKHEQVFMDHKKNSYLYCFLKLVSCRTAVKLWLNLFFFFAENRNHLPAGQNHVGYKRLIVCLLISMVDYANQTVTKQLF